MALAVVTRQIPTWQGMILRDVDAAADDGVIKAK
jgi:hypothetical protein